MLEQQGGVCAICKEPNQDFRRMHVDHCHKTLRVRGLLCIRCNTTLGMIERVGIDKFVTYASEELLAYEFKG